MGNKEILILAGAAALAWVIVRKFGQPAKPAPAAVAAPFVTINPLAYTAAEDRHGINGL